MENGYLYLDGFTLGLALIILLFCLVCFAFVAKDYLYQIRRGDRLQVKYNNCRADLSAAQMELQGMKLKGYGQSRTPVPTKEIATGAKHLRNDLSGAECTYKVEPGSRTPSVTHSRATFPKGEGREIASMMSGSSGTSTPTSNAHKGAVNNA